MPAAPGKGLAFLFGGKNRGVDCVNTNEERGVAYNPHDACAVGNPDKNTIGFIAVGACLGG